MKASRFISILVAGIAFVLIPTSSVRGQSYGPYFEVDGGVNFIKDTSVQVGSLPGNLSLDAGFRIDAVVGYEFNRWLAIEVEGGYFQNSIRSVDLHNQGASPGDSTLSGIPLLGSVVLRYENSTDFVPYIGAGAGGMVGSLKISGVNDSDSVFAYQGKIGVIYKLEERAWVDVGYKILVAQEQNYSISGTSIRTDRTLNHFLGASVTWKF